jgi:5-methylcytosine-specific restriction endonuclease McrBC GTP-binding regulatory subunit McrB
LVYTKIEDRKKFLGPKLGLLIKHSGRRKMEKVMPEHDVCDYYINLYSSHVKNEKIYSFGIFKI